MMAAAVYTEEEVLNELVSMGIVNPTDDFIRNLRNEIAITDRENSIRVEQGEEIDDDDEQILEHPFSMLEVDEPAEPLRQGAQPPSYAKSPIRPRPSSRNPEGWRPHIPDAKDQITFTPADPLIIRAYDRIESIYRFCGSMERNMEDLDGMTVEDMMRRGEQLRQERRGQTGSDELPEEEMDEVEYEEDFEEDEEEEEAQEEEGSSNGESTPRIPSRTTSTRTARTAAQQAIRPVLCPSPGRVPFKHDPVNMNRIYKEEWKRLPAPGENKRLRLRWKIREQLMQRDIPRYDAATAALDVPPLQHPKDWSPRPYLP